MSSSNGLFIEKHRFFPSILQSDKINLKISFFVPRIGLFRKTPIFAATSAIFALLKNSNNLFFSFFLK